LFPPSRVILRWFLSTWIFPILPLNAPFPRQFVIISYPTFRRTFKITSLVFCLLLSIQSTGLSCEETVSIRPTS
jgi:hypothetical protein